MVGGTKKSALGTAAGRGRDSQAGGLWRVTLVADEGSRSARWSLIIPLSGGADASAIFPLCHTLSTASLFMDNHDSEQARNPDWLCLP